MTARPRAKATPERATDPGPVAVPWDPAAALRALVEERDTLTEELARLRSQLAESETARYSQGAELKILEVFAPLVRVRELLLEAAKLKSWHVEWRESQAFGPLRKWQLHIEGANGWYCLQLGFDPPNEKPKFFTVHASDFEALAERISEGLKVVADLTTIYQQLDPLLRPIKASLQLTPQAFKEVETL